VNTNTQNENKINISIDIAVKLGLLVMAVYISFLIAKPFIAIVVWGIIIAIAISPLINKLQNYYSNKKMIVILFTIAVISILVIPTYLLSDKVIDSTQNLISSLENGKISIPAPNENVKEWPIIGKKLYAFWSSASVNIQTTLEPFTQNIKNLATSIFSALGNGIATIFMFIGSMIIAAIFLLNSEASTKFYTKVLKRLVGKKAEEWATLSTVTVRSVVTGVIGVAVIQAFFAAIGLVLMDIPLSLFWALLIMFLTIIQVPALLVIGPIIAYVFSQGSGTPEIIFTIYMLIVGASDGVLKPMLMGRGLDIPMLVILIGAIGGMILMGMIGLFVGAVIFALTYELFILWVNENQEV